MLTLLSGAAMSVLRRLDPEDAHRLALRALRLGLAGRSAAPDHPALAVNALGRTFSNPIGLAAGFDKNAEAGRALMELGFGFIETGTVTPRPQPGNPRPRIFRLTPDQAIINRLGFNNQGVEAYKINLKALTRRTIPLGANVGINKEGADPVRDYKAMVAAVSPLADYVVINVSSPNTPGLRDLQGEQQLQSILSAVAEVPDRPPVLVKVAPDLSIDGLGAVVETCISFGLAGLIVGNTTISRPPSLVSPLASETGGLSGVPLQALSTAMLARAAGFAAGRLTLIGTGGVFTGADVLRKIQAGATLVQLYTAFAYHGPGLIPRLKAELLEALRREGLATVRDAVATRAEVLAAAV
ncbi:MAG: quinone-dependent dihydroorotate dehydrogenase [Proteobacteria bacterium]|nr:quinone-dependent dihydroorotate dehydrogenase [Pseudomonadota bacterium]